MIQYTFSLENPTHQYIHIEMNFATKGDETIIHLPSWRPGRYELGNFAKNVKFVKAFSKDGKVVPVTKSNKDTWVLSTKGVEEVKVNYAYYASEINAGSSYLSKDHLYVNPVNCCMWVEGQESSEHHIKLEIPEDWKVACSMKQTADKTLSATSFDELADSPFIASSTLQHDTYESNNVKFHLWFNGEVKVDWDRLVKDFKAFTDAQIAKFTEFPTDEYHFLFQILPYKSYHGVEHSKSTVISLGPSYDVFGELYKELLGVSSHELYHTWNVKAIRPIEMFPYDFTQENYSKLGYVCEGVTTYLGDLYLLKSKVFNQQQYLDELDNQLQRHFDNHGRFNYSVAQSSFDTWLDGYTPGAPNRKVSIYTEGCLLAFVADVMLLKATNAKYGIDEVMKRLYFNFALQNKGVSEQDYKDTLEAVGGISFDEYFADFVNGSRPFEGIITEALEELGLELTHEPSKKYSFGRMGVKCLESVNETIVKALYPGGPMELGGVQLEDKIIAVNKMKVAGDLDKWLNYFDDDQKTITVERSGHYLDIIIPEVNRNFYSTYKVKPVKEPNGPQKKLYDAWSK